MNSLQDDIKKYLDGKLSQAERHALEKKALSDPFLADALEGGESISPADFDSDVQWLHDSLRKKTGSSTGGRSVWYWPLRIAAAIAFVVVAGYTAKVLFTDPEAIETPLALNKDLDSAVVAPFSYSQPAPAESATEPDAGPKPVIETQTQEEDRAEAAQPPRSQPGIRQGSGEETALLKDDSQLSAVAESREEVSSIAGYLAKDTIQVADVNDASGYKSKKVMAAPSVAATERAQAMRTVRGLVTDKDDDIPMPGVNVVVKGTSIGSVTDLNGNFELEVPEGSQNLVFSYIGMETKEVAITSNQLSLQMTPDVSQLSEVVVIGYDGEEQPFEGVMWELAEPEGGRKEYRKYLEQNLSYPKLAMDNQIEGKVTIQFTIQPSGQLSDFKVVRSIGYGCDEEVIRLIAEGPKWTPTKRNNEPVRGRGKVKVRFTLPAKQKK
jgi:TonB family protein